MTDTNTRMEFLADYFILRFRMLNRHLADFGLHPAAGWILGLAAFTGFSFYLSSRFQMAGWILAALGFSVVERPGRRDREDFLRLIYPHRRYLLIRMLENLALVMPFAVFLAFKREWFPLAAILSLAGMEVFTRPGGWPGLVLPTPFGRNPYEAATGFRRTWLIFPAALLLAVAALAAGNPNLGLFALGLAILSVFTWYLQPEPLFYIWIFRYGPSGFLLRKIWTGFRQASLLWLPFILLSLYADTGRWWLPLALWALGLLLLAGTMLAKYASYPHEISIPNLLLLAISVSFPPLLAGVLPYFFLRSGRRLKTILP